jgi:hypothetical protein
VRTLFHEIHAEPSWERFVAMLQQHRDREEITDFDTKSLSFLAPNLNPSLDRQVHLRAKETKEFFRLWLAQGEELFTPDFLKERNKTKPGGVVSGVSGLFLTRKK